MATDLRFAAVAIKPMSKYWRFAVLQGGLQKEGRWIGFRPVLVWRTGMSEHLLIPGIVDFPNIVHDAMVDYGEIFSNVRQRCHFAECLNGLMVAEHKTVLDING